MPIYNEPLPPAVTAILVWGNTDVDRTVTARFLSPCWEAASAGTVAIQFAVPVAGTLSNLYVHAGTGAGNGNAIVYTVRINGTPTAVTVSMASTATDGNDTLHSVSVAQGDLVDISVTKALDVGAKPQNILATLRIAA